MFIQLQYTSVLFSSSVLRKSCFSSYFQISIRFVMLVPPKIPEKEILHELQFHQHGFHSSFDQPTTPKSQPKNHHHPTKPSKFHNNKHKKTPNQPQTTPWPAFYSSGSGFSKFILLVVLRSSWRGWNLGSDWVFCVDVMAIISGLAA